MRMNSGVRTDDVLRLLEDASLPESIRGALTSGNELTSISLDSEGQWRHEGELFVNTNLMALFHRSIRRTAGGTYFLQIPPFSYPIVVSDTPRYVRHIRWSESTQRTEIKLFLSDGSEELLDPYRLSYVPERGLYCQVLAPDEGYWSARFLRPAYYSISEHIIEQDDEYFLDLPSGRVSIPVVAV